MGIYHLGLRRRRMIFEGVSKTTYPMKKMDNAQLYWPFVSFKEVASPRTLAFPMFALADRFSIHIITASSGITHLSM